MPLDLRRAGRAALACFLLAIFTGRSGYKEKPVAYKSNQTDKVDVKALPPLFRVTLSDLANLTQDAVVQDHSVKLAEGLEGGIDGLLGEREICQVAIDYLDLLGVLLFQLLQRLDTAGNNHDIVCLRCSKQVLGHCETNAWKGC